MIRLSRWSSTSMRRHLGQLQPQRPVTLSHAKAGIDKFAENLSLLQENGNKSLAVTEFITQYDELRQVDLQNQERPTNLHMERGARIHQALEDAVQTSPDQVFFDPKAELELDRNVTQYINLVDKILTLGRHLSSEYGVVRELPIRGTVPGSMCVLRGVIDCLYISDEGIVIMETKTTRKVSPTLTRLAYHQALTYHYLLSSMLKADPLRMVPDYFDLEVPNIEVARDYFRVHQAEFVASVDKLAAIGLAPYINLQFLTPHGGRGQLHETVYEIPYDDEVLQQIVQSRINLYTGARSPYNFALRDAPPTSGEHHLITTESLVEASDCTLSQKAALRL